MKYILLLLISFNVFAIDIVSERRLVNAVSMGASSTSSAIELNQFSGISIMASVTASAAAVGSLKLQASNDWTAEASIVNWVDIASSSNAVAGNGSFLWNLNDSYYKWVRLVYTRTSGSGTLNAQWNVKDSNANNR